MNLAESEELPRVDQHLLSFSTEQWSRSKPHEANGAPIRSRFAVVETEVSKECLVLLTFLFLWLRFFTVLQILASLLFSNKSQHPQHLGHEFSVLLYELTIIIESVPI